MLLTIGEVTLVAVLTEIRTVVEGTNAVIVCKGVAVVVERQRKLQNRQTRNLIKSWGFDGDM